MVDVLPFGSQLVQVLADVEVRLLGWFYHLAVYFTGECPEVFDVHSLRFQHFLLDVFRGSPENNVKLLNDEILEPWVPEACTLGWFVARTASVFQGSCSSV